MQNTDEQSTGYLGPQRVDNSPKLLADTLFTMGAQMVEMKADADQKDFFYSEMVKWRDRAVRMEKERDSINHLLKVAHEDLRTRELQLEKKSEELKLISVNLEDADKTIASFRKEILRLNKQIKKRN